MTIEIRRVRRSFSRVLAAWSVVSVVVGVPMWFVVGGPFVGAMGSQFAIWGAIDLVFAALGLKQAREADRMPVAPDHEPDVREARKLLATLQVSHKLNRVWLATAAGLGIWAALASSTSLWGHAVGVLVQGGFLFFYDRRFDRAVARAVGQSA